VSIVNEAPGLVLSPVLRFDRKVINPDFRKLNNPGLRTWNSPVL
jgi:hypothetical protein